MTIVYGVTREGFNQKRLPEIKENLENLFIQEFSDVNLDPQSVIGQIIGIFSKVFADIWENEANVYLSQYLASASGVSLDNVVAISGITRIQAQRTIVVGIATGVENTFIPINTLVKVPNTNQTFYSIQNAFITSSNSAQNTVNVNALSAQEYKVVLSGVTYLYSKPIITFSGPIVAGNIIQTRINGINIPGVPFNTNSATTLNDLVTTITTILTAVTSGSIVGNAITLTPTLGSQIIVNTVLVTGIGAPTATITFAVPLNLSEIAEYLSANIDNSTIVSSTWVSGQTFQIKTLDSQVSYSLIVGTGLEITSVSSPILFLAQNIGVVPVPANSMTEIITPIAGWQSITNFDAGITGRDIETDVELRLRALLSTRSAGLATVEAIRSRLLQDVPNITSVTIFENVTLTQENVVISFSQDFVTLNNIQVFINANLIGNVVFNTNHLTTINLIATLLQSQPEVLLATVMGVGNRQITLVMNPTFIVNPTFNITLGASQPTYIISGGRPPKSFETVVAGGLNANVALSIWKSKPAGIQTFGNTTVITLDSQGNNQAISFTRATPVYIWVIATIVLNPQEIFPVNGLQLISNAILAYGNTLGIGIDVLIQRVESAVFSVSGVASVVVQLAKTLSPTDNPAYGFISIPIANIENSSFNLSRITVGI